MREFREKDHTYWVDGKQYVGVNELLTNEGLIQDLEKVVPAHILEPARVKGNIVHKIAEFTCKGTIEATTIDKRLLNQKAQIDAFLADFEVVPTYVEKILWDDNKRFVGTSDLPACKTNKGLAIVDWSSGETDHFLQMHAYKMLVKTALNIDIETLIDVQLPDNGKYKVKIYKPDRKIELVIMSALMVYNFKNRRM